MEKIYSSKLISIKSGSTMREAKEIMREKRIRHLPITNSENYITGILTAHDMTDVVKFHDMPVDIFASFPVKYVTPETTLSEVALKMIADKISGLIVVKNEAAIGIITTDDLLFELSQILKNKEDGSSPIWSDALVTAGELCRKLADVGI